MLPYELGSLAAGFQSFMYGGFTPAGGIFATLTSLAMLGILAWYIAAGPGRALVSQGAAIRMLGFETFLRNPQGSACQSALRKFDSDDRDKLVADQD